MEKRSVRTFDQYRNLLFYFRIQEESIRWLLINNRVKEAERVVRKAAKMNKVSYDEVMKKLEQIKKEKRSVLNTPEITLKVIKEDMEIVQTDSVTVSKVVKYNATYLFREGRLFVNSLILWFSW